MIHCICAGRTNTRRQEQGPAEYLIKLPQVVEEAMSREGFLGICNTKKKQTNKNPKTSTQKNSAKQDCGV